MTESTTQPRTQAEYWDEQAGPKWVRHADALDAMLEPFLELVLKRAQIRATDRVLDIGCGAGALSLAAAKTAAHVIGVDVSRPLLALAERRASALTNTAFIHADAATLDAQTTGSIDVAVSRFGVMFFEDPVKAFTRIASVMPAPASLVFACWREPKFNPWATLPMQVAAPLLEVPLPTPEPHAPGPFAFSNRSYIRSVLQDAEWPNIEINANDVDIVLPGGSPEEAAAFMLEMGPLTAVLERQGLSAEQVLSPLSDALSKHVRSDGRVACSGSAWIVEASL